MPSEYGHRAREYRHHVIRCTFPALELFFAALGVDVRRSSPHVRMHIRNPVQYPASIPDVKPEVSYCRGGNGNQIRLLECLRLVMGILVFFFMNLNRYHRKCRSFGTCSQFESTECTASITKSHNHAAQSWSLESGGCTCTSSPLLPLTLKSTTSSVNALN